MYLIVFFLVFMISLFEAGGQSLAYMAHKKSSFILLALSWLFYIVIVVLLYFSYKYKGVGYINILWSGMTTLLMILIGYFIFNERLNLIEWIGTGFIFIGIFLISSKKILKYIY